MSLVRSIAKLFPVNTGINRIFARLGASYLSVPREYGD